LGLVHPGVRKVAGQIQPYTRFWSEQNNGALAAGPPLLVVIGDSAAIGVGASRPENGYIGRLQVALSRRDAQPWQVVNLGRSGAKVDDAVDRQLPVAQQLAAQGLPALTLCCIGSNDVLWNRSNPDLRVQLQDLIARLPKPAIVGLVAGGGPASRAANRAIRQAAASRDLPVVDPWRRPGSVRLKLAEDGFHPNDDGYRSMAGAFAEALGAPDPSLVSEPGPSDGPHPPTSP
jgi:lysophospholipase L1-like esterase